LDITLILNYTFHELAARSPLAPALSVQGV
jgi:hypothetical protein